MDSGQMALPPPFFLEPASLETVLTVGTADGMSIPRARASDCPSLALGSTCSHVLSMTSSNTGVFVALDPQVPRAREGNLSIVSDSKYVQLCGPFRLRSLQLLNFTFEI